MEARERGCQRRPGGIDKHELDGSALLHLPMPRVHRRLPFETLQTAFSLKVDQGLLLKVQGSGCPRCAKNRAPYKGAVSESLENQGGGSEGRQPADGVRSPQVEREVQSLACTEVEGEAILLACIEMESGAGP